MGLRLKTRVAAMVLAAGAAVAGVVAMPASGTATTRTPALRAFGILADGTVMCEFQTDTPQRLAWVRSISGLTGQDTKLIGIDFRVQDRKFYGVGNYGGVYTVTTPTGANDPVIVAKVSQLSLALDGTKFGVDFNPAADRLRVISDNGQNLRHDLASHVTAVDYRLTNNGLTATGVTAAAYTNNDLNTDTDTTLFDLNTVTDRVVVQSPANNGLLAPTGKLGPNIDLDAGLDIYSDVVAGKTVANLAFATVLVGGVGKFVSLDPLTGTAIEIGQFPLPVTDVAVALGH